MTARLGKVSRTFSITKKVVVGPCYGSVSNMIVSDCLAELGGAVMVLRDSLDGPGTAAGWW